MLWSPAGSIAPRTAPRALLVSVLALGIGACRNLTDPSEGTQQGRPQTAAFRLAPLTGMQAEAAQTMVDEFLYTDCDGIETRVGGGQLVDLRGGTLVSLEAGEWCGLQFQFQQPITANGLTYGGLPWELELEVLFTSVGNGVPFKILDDRYYVFELGEPDWFRASDLAPEDTAVASVRVDSSHPAHAELAGKVALRSGLLEDADGSTSISSSERPTSLVARGADRQTFTAR